MFTPTKGALAALALVASASAAAVSDKAAAAATVEKLRVAPLATDRINILNTDDQFVFDFFSPNTPATAGAGGKIITANAATFPAVVGQGSAMAVGILDACSMNTPHTHPRATEMQISVNATIRTGMITENGGRFIMTELPPGSMTVFPQGSIHFQLNDGCHPALFVAGFNSEDPGVLSVAQRFLGLPPDIVAATLGDLGVEEVVGLESQIPDNVAIATDACLHRCGLKRPDQPHKQLQPKLPGNSAGGPFSGGSGSGSDKKPPTTTMTTKPTETPSKNDGGYESGNKKGGYGQDSDKGTTTKYSGAPQQSGKPMTHLIKVGADGLTFTPPRTSAAVGDIVLFEFHPKNHTVTQSSFAEPCKSLTETSTKGEVGFKSGFVPVSPNATYFPTFNITIKDLNPIWGYCGQQGPPIHCREKGMVFAINSKEDTPNNFAAFQALATKGASSSVPTASAPAGKIAAALASDGDESSSGGSNKPSPALIALLAINGVLFIGLVVLGVLYFRKHRAASRVARHRQLYTSVGANGEPLFVASEKPDAGSSRRSPPSHPRILRAGPAPGEEDDEANHALTHGPYYDPHEPKGYHDRD